MKDGEQMRDQQQGQHHGGDEPRSDALDNPVNFPGPTLDSPKRYEIAGRREAADPVIDNANEWVRTHTHLGSGFGTSALILREPCDIVKYFVY
jgi:hypothetical protein